MERFWQITAGVLLTVVLAMVLGKGSKDLSLVLILVACTMVLTAAFFFLEPVMDFLRQLQSLGRLDTGISDILIKAVGIGLIGELAVLICNDSGNAALGKALQIMTAAVILWLSLPLMKALLELIQRIMGEL